jgi:tetratricopeptide (TPR) repeat protein
MATTIAASLDTLTRIIEMQPGTESAARAHLELGILQIERGELESATQSLRQVPPHWPRWHGRAGLAIARIYETQLRDIGAAAREYRKVIRRHPDTHAAAECHARLADIHDAMGDALSAENMRECAMRSYHKVIETTHDEQEREEALARFVTASRQLERWDLALQALERQRTRTIGRRDVVRRHEIDRQLAEIHELREHHERALVRYRECLAHARRNGTTAEVVELSEAIARCMRRTEADAGALRRHYLTLLEHVGSAGPKLTEVLRDARLVPILVRALLACDRAPEVRRHRSRLARQASAEAKASVAALDAEVATAK